MVDTVNDDDAIGIADFVQQRSTEMQVMLELSQKVSRNNAPQQQLPRHMRRRAASHNVKRLPISLRMKFLKEAAKSGLTMPKKRPSRKHRRRPKNLFAEYARRCGKKRWLETHIWHAKRFHMAELWNCKIALHRNDRGNRAAWRDSKNECLLLDLSWLCILEIEGPECKILEMLQIFTDCRTGLPLSNCKCLSGEREGFIMLYEKNGYPHSPICIANFMWKEEIQKQTNRSLLLWVHPSTFDLLLNTFVKELNLDMIPDRPNCFSNDSLKVLTRTADFCRYRLIGPKSKIILSAAFHLSNLNSHNFVTFLSDREKQMFSEQQENWLNYCKFPSMSTITDNVIHGIMVGDPRLNMPKKRIHPEPSVVPNIGNETVQSFKSWALSLIWRNDYIEELKNLKLSTDEMNKKRSLMQFKDYNPAIPILLVHNPGSNGMYSCLGRGAGWDIIIPSGWGMYFWVGLIYRGARSIGLNEMKHLDFEHGRLTFPNLYPDCKAGKILDLSNYKELQLKYSRMPPAKRCNYEIYKVQTPFHFPWNELCKEWYDKFKSPTSIDFDGFYVIRDVKFLNELHLKFTSNGLDKNNDKSDNLMDKGYKVLRRIRIQGSSKCYLEIMKNGIKKKIVECSFGIGLSYNYLSANIEKYLHGLVPIHIVVIGKGVPEKFSIVYIPNKEDLEAISDHKGIESEVCKFRKKKHSLKCENRKNKTTKNVKEMEIDDFPKVSNLLTSDSRTIIGFIVAGGFSFTFSKGVGIGFVSLPGLLNLHKFTNEVNSNRVVNKIFNKNLDMKTTVLIRSTKSVYFRYASLSILLPNL